MADHGWLAHLGVLALLAVVPFLVVVGTSFAKVAVVLGITKNAIGGQGVIPVTVITGLALVVTMFIMGPVVDDMLQVPLPGISSVPTTAAQSPPGTAPDASVFDDAKAVYTAMAPILTRFLRQNTPDGELQFFKDLDASGSSGDASIRVLLLAFASNELIEAFVLGVLILIPFLVVDVIVANTLTALGLTALSPLAVSLPLKLLLFIAADGWHLLINALILSYNVA